MKQLAIKENHLYQKAYQKGKRCICNNVSVFVLRDFASERIRKSDPMKRRHNRVGIASPKKIGGAVARNRARRIIREAYRLTDLERPVLRGNLIVITAREGATLCKMQDVKKDLAYAFTKLEMFAK